jgi:signal transduction histidine kinase
MNRHLNQLAINMNKCLKAEENLRLESVREEKRFKELITNISHDLRTPLTAIKGYQQLMEKSELSQDQNKKLQIAKKHTEKLGQLIEHVYEYTFLENVDQTPELIRINLTNLVAETIIDSIPILEEKNLTIDFRDTAPIYILGDKVMVTRIVQNLIRNGIQHSDGTMVVRLHERNKAILSFSNPIDKSKRIDVGRLFERFYVGDKSRSNSTGLGLSIVKLLAEQMNGSVGASLENGLLNIQVELPLD